MLFRRAMLGLMCVALVAGCEDGGTGPADGVPVEVRLSAETLDLEDGDTATLAATLVDRDGDVVATPPPGTTFVWSVDDPEVARVVDGKVSTLKPGSTRVRVAAGAFSAEAQLIVRRGRVGSVTVSGPIPLGDRQSRQYQVVVRDTLGAALENVPVEWASLNTAIATVDAQGVVTGKAPGIVSITATAGKKTGGIILQVYSVRVSFPSDSVVLSLAGAPELGTRVQVSLIEPTGFGLGSSADFSVSDSSVVRFEGCDNRCTGSIRGSVIYLYPKKVGVTRLIASWLGAADTTTVRVAP